MSDLYRSMTSAFDLLAKPIQRLLAERGFREPTLPQQGSIEKILDGKNVLLIAPAGTGKTEAAFLPLLHQILLAPREPGTKILYVTPLKALNRDLLDRLQWWCSALDLRIAVRHGDTAMPERRKQALVPPDVWITTPETLQILLAGRRLSQHLRSVRWVIVDEVHELADNKRGAQLSLTLERLRRLKGGDFQLIGLSATIGSPQLVAKWLVGVGRSCEVIDVSVARELRIKVLYPQPTQLDERLASRLYTYPTVAARLRAMRRLIDQHGSTLVFTNTRPTAEVLASRFHLWDIDFPVSVHHGSLSSFSRLRAEKGLKQGRLKGIICTSSMELGLDIGLIDLVIQYSSPHQVTRLLQRVGRSGHRIGEVAEGAIVVQDQIDALESIVIADRSKRRELEPVSIPEKPWDVLLHGLVSLLVVQGRGSIDEAYELFRKAYPFRDITRDDIVNVLKFATSLGKRLVWADDQGFARPRMTDQFFNYYYSNLSMIPEVSQYLVIDDEQHEPIGTLDESFVAQYGEPGVKFVMGGKLWRIIQVFGEKVYTKPDDDPIGAIPTWVGEEIPVPYSVAQDVGKLLAQVEDKGFKESIDELAKLYNSSPNLLKGALSEAYKQAKAALPLPTDKRILIEKTNGICIIYACFGTLVNRALAHMLAQKASAEYGVATSVDPYRILLRSELLEPKDIVEMLKGELRVADQIIERSGFFRWRLVQVARRMGMVEVRAELTRSAIDKLVRVLRGTLPYDEAMKEVMCRDLDLKRAEEVLSLIREGKIELCHLELAEPTPLSKMVMGQRLTFEPVMADRFKLLAIASVKTRLLTKARTFACTDCKRWVKELQIYELDEKPTCPICGSTRLGMIEAPAEEVWGAIDKSERGRKSSAWQAIERSSKLIEGYGKLGALAMAGHITQATANRILAKEPKFSNEFIELLMEEEKDVFLRRFS